MLFGWRSDATLIGVFVALAALAHNGAPLSGWAFLANQTDCRLSCQNGGVCAFDRDAPHRHKCICFVGMFYGEQCEFVVSSEDPNNSAASSSMEEEVTANGALKAGVSAPDQEALAPPDDPDAPYADPPAGVGGSLDGAADAVIPDTAGDQTAGGVQNNAALEEPSYDSEAMLNNEPIGPSATLPVVPDVPPADEVELLRNEATQPHGRDAYSRLDVDDAPTSAVAPRADERDNVLAPPDEVTAPSAWHGDEEQQQKREQQQQQQLNREQQQQQQQNREQQQQQQQLEQQQQQQQQLEQQKESQEQMQLDVAGAPAMGPADGMGGSFLTANDEFHAAPNVKHYEEHPRSTQSHYAPSAPIDTVAPSTSTAATVAAARREKTRRKHHRKRPTTTPTPADSDWNNGDGGDEDEDDGWMISAKGRRRVNAAPSTAAVPTRLGRTALWAVTVAMTFFQISEHFSVRFG